MKQKVFDPKVGPTKGKVVGTYKVLRPPASPDAVIADHINEATPGHGVVVDGVTLKDGGALVVTGGANTFNLTNGTASLDVAAAAAVDIDAELHVEAATHVNQDLTTDAGPQFAHIHTDQLVEITGAHGIDIDGWHIKDGGAGVITGGTNTFNITNGTAILDIAAGANINLDYDLSLGADTSITSFAATILDDTNAAAIIATLGLDADIATLSLPASTTITTAGAAILDDANAAAQCTTLGLGTGDGPTFDHLHITNNASVGTLNVATFGVTVEAASILNQDLTTDAGPQFAHIHTDQLVEVTVGHGIDIDGWHIKDGGAGIITGGTNTFNITNGTASLDVAASCAVDINANLTVETASTVNQDLTSDAGPTFDHLHITNNAAVGTLNVATFAVTVEAASALNQDLTTDAGPTFDHLHLNLDLAVLHGGTGASTLEDHGVLVGSGAIDAITALAVGTNGQVLVGSTGADPIFATITDGEGIDTTLGAGTLQIACEDASDANKGVVELSTDAQAQYGVELSLAVTPANLRSVTYQHAKAQIINAVYSIVTPANVRLFYIFGDMGNTDRSVIGGTTAHILTFRDAALGAISCLTCSPGGSGSAPYVTLDTTHMWNTPDVGDLSFGNGTTDSAFSIVTLCNPTDVSGSVILGKWNDTGGSEAREYIFYFDGSDKLRFYCYDESANASIGRFYNTALTTDQGQWHTYMSTKSTGVTAAAINLYRDGAVVDDTDAIVGSYVAMEDLAVLPASYYTSTTPQWGFKGLQSVIIVVAEELTAIQVARLDVVLRGYAGVVI